MIEVYEKWAKPEADGAMDTAWNAVVSALVGMQGEHNASLGAEKVLFRAFGNKAEAFFALNWTGTSTLDGLPSNGKGTHRGGIVTDVGNGTLYQIAPGAKQVTLSGASGDLFKVEIWF